MQDYKFLKQKRICKKERMSYNEEHDVTDNGQLGFGFENSPNAGYFSPLMNDSPSQSFITEIVDVYIYDTRPQLIAVEKIPLCFYNENEVSVQEIVDSVLKKVPYGNDFLISFYPYERSIAVKEGKAEVLKGSCVKVSLIWDFQIRVYPPWIPSDNPVKGPQELSIAPLSPRNVRIVDSPELPAEHTEEFKMGTPRLRGSNVKTKSVPKPHLGPSAEKPTKRRLNRSIRAVVKEVYQWRILYTKGKNSLEEAAMKVGTKKKTLDDYYLNIKKARLYGFDFNGHAECRIGAMYKFIRSRGKSKQYLIYNPPFVIALLNCTKYILSDIRKQHNLTQWYILYCSPL
eukprot:TRINITY_DN553_c0_g1_i2.p1 TRINITY_DN553_c0_g1~~TRINITY_DN553_c0_g1_i2.p1  ORF type:complete len:343 (+),score=0.57 TRINITY_DN553_c0_g1_i2:637-1665(+)